MATRPHRHDQFVIVGDILVNVFYVLPLPSMLKCFREHQQPPTTIWFYSAGLFNCIAWVVYAHLRSDPYIHASNTLPLLLMWLYVGICLHVISSDQARIFLFLNCLQMTIFVVVSVLTQQLINTLYAMQQVWGTLGDVWDTIMLVAPLTDVFAILARGDATRRISLPLCMMTIVNSALWGIYGVLQNSAVLILPNIITGISGILQLGTWFHVQKKARTAAPTPVPESPLLPPGLPVSQVHTSPTLRAHAELRAGTEYCAP